MRAIVHVWPSHYASKILKHLRDAAIPGKTRFILIYSIVEYACAETLADAAVTPDAILPGAHEPLLSNFGSGTGIAYLADLQYVFHC